MHFSTTVDPSLPTNIFINCCHLHSRGLYPGSISGCTCRAGHPSIAHAGSRAHMLGTNQIAVLRVSAPCDIVADMAIRRNVLPPSSTLTKLWLGNHYYLINTGMSRGMNCKLQATNHAWESFIRKENVWHVRMGRDILSLWRCTIFSPWRSSS